MVQKMRNVAIEFLYDKLYNTNRLKDAKDFNGENETARRNKKWGNYRFL